MTGSFTKAALGFRFVTRTRRFVVKRAPHIQCSSPNFADNLFKLVYVPSNRRADVRNDCFESTLGREADLPIISRNSRLPESCICDPWHQPDHN